MREQEISSLLRVTRRAFQILNRQSRKGWKLDIPLAHQQLKELTLQSESLEDQLRPRLPLVLVPKSRRKNWPQKQFNKNGSASHFAKLYYGEDHSKYRVDRIHDHEPLNLRNPAQVVDFLYTQGWVPTEWNFKKDEDGKKVRTSPKLTEDSFDSIKGETGQEIALLRKVWSRMGDIKRYLNNLTPEGRVITPVSGKTVTHRMRHSVVVNVPGEEAFYGPELRSLFAAPSGSVVVGCDSDSCQLRMLLHRMASRGLHNEEFSNALLYGSKEDGTDAHSRNAGRVNEILGKEVLNRRAGKEVFYATIFGGGVSRIASLLSCSQAEAKAVINAFITVLPELPDLKKQLLSELQQQGYLSALDGRPLYIRSPHMALVSLMQGDEAVCMEYSMCWADQQTRIRQLDAFQLIYYHDEFEYESTVAHAPEVARLLEDAIAWPGEYLGLQVELTGSASIGSNWAEVH